MDEKPTNTVGTFKKETDKDTSLSTARQAIPGSIPTSGPQRPVPFNYLKGWRAQISRVALYFCIFLANFEVSVMSTSLVAITNDLHDLKNTSWIVTAYLITYTVFILIWTKFCQAFKQKQVQCVALLIFVVFSAACGGAQTMTQLIVLRAFQGIGGAGLYAVPTIMCFELSPPEQRQKYMAVLAGVFAMSYVLGPLLGGAISSNTTWRWVFLLNVPASAVAIILLLIALPSDFPYQGDHPNNPWGNNRVMSRESLQKIDFPGIFLLLAASVLLIFTLEEAGGMHYQWSSPLVISCLLISMLLWIFFFAWQIYLSRTDKRAQQPIFPWQLLRNRFFIGMISNSLTVGAVYTISVVQTPQRTQTVNNLSPLQAGYRLLPLVLGSPLGSFVTSIIAKQHLLPHFYTLLIAATIQVLGASLLSTLPTKISINAAQYGYELILGFGLGISISALFLTVSESIELKHQAITLGAITQARSFGGAIGLAAVMNVLISSLTSSLSELSPDLRREILQSASAIDGLTLSAQLSTRSKFGNAYNEQMRIVIGIAIAQFLATLLIWKRKVAQ